MPTRRIVVGFDESPTAVSTLEWAAHEAAARDCGLRVVACLTVPDSVDYYGIGERQRTSLTAAVADVRRVYNGLRVREVETNADPRDRLLAEAVGAELLIVGASTSGSGHRALFGSIPRVAARRSSCPVVVVRRGRPSHPIRRIVVGVDGSNAAAAALDWAIEETNLHHADLTLVHAWQRPSVGDRSIRSNELRRADAGCVLDLALRSCEQRTDQHVDGHLAECDAATALAAASHDADLLVIGSRGRSGFKTMVFGSVALSLVDSAGCSVVVLHPHLRFS